MQINCLACYLVHINIKCTIDHSKCKISPKDGGLLFNRFHICSRVGLFATPWTVVHQVLLSMEFSRQEYWSGFPFPSPGDLPNLGIKPRSPALQADSLPSKPPGKQKCCWESSGSDLVTKLYPTLAIPWTLACQAPLSMGFPRQEYWNRLPFPSPGDLPHPGMEARSPALQADSLPTDL